MEGVCRVYTFVLGVRAYLGRMMGVSAMSSVQVNIEFSRAFWSTSGVESMEGWHGEQIRSTGSVFEELK